METLLLNGIIALLAGSLLNFMPCVLPVIPFKIQAILKTTNGSMAARLQSAAALMAGSLIFFAGLGVVSSLLGVMWGQFFQYPVFRVLLSLFFLASAVATFGGWSVRLPQAVYRLSRSGHLTAFLTGALAGLLSTPCSGPFLGSVLAFAATRPPIESVAIFCAIGVGLAAPLGLLLLYPGLLARIPFSGRWAVLLKRWLGVVLLGAALFFIQDQLSPWMRQLGWWGLVLTAATMLAMHVTAGSRKRFRPVFIVAVAMAAMSVFHYFPLNADGQGIPWQAYSDTRLADSAGQPRIVYFGADWCINCQALEKTTFTDRDLQQGLATMGFTPLKVDLTHIDDTGRGVFERYGGYAIPYVVLLDRNGRLVERFTGVVGAAQLKTQIQQLAQIRG